MTLHARDMLLCKSYLIVRCYYGHINMLRLFVERGCQRLIAAKDNQGETVENVATRFGHEALAGMLRQARVAKAGLDVWGRRGLVC